MGEKKYTTVWVSETVKSQLDELKLVGRFNSFDQLFESMIPYMKYGILRSWAEIADALGRGRFDKVFESDNYSQRSATE